MEQLGVKAYGYMGFFGHTRGMSLPWVTVMLWWMVATK